MTVYRCSKGSTGVVRVQNDGLEQRSPVVLDKINHRTMYGGDTGVEKKEGCPSMPDVGHPQRANRRTSVSGDGVHSNIFEGG